MTKKQEPPDYRKLIPELESYFGKHPVDLITWLGGIGRYDHALAYAALFWPDFVEIDGCVFLGSAIPEAYEDWKAKAARNPSEAQALFNHLHIFDLFGSEEAPAAELVRILGIRLKEMWTAKLMRDFPGREFVVSFDENFDPEVDNPDITFYEKR